ncbi:unnamed protein product, partial [Effrenium voratum]
RSASFSPSFSRQSCANGIPREAAWLQVGRVAALVVLRRRGRAGAPRHRGRTKAVRLAAEAVLARAVPEPDRPHTFAAQAGLAESGAASGADLGLGRGNFGGLCRASGAARCCLAPLAGPGHGARGAAHPRAQGVAPRQAVLCQTQGVLLRTSRCHASGSALEYVLAAIDLSLHMPRIRLSSPK